jgi:2-polyprenyl-3-methyl-5-hydroxy-6-metoxy-1,4-benzoquinol methylase
VDHKKLAFLVEEIERIGPPPIDILEVGCGSGNIALPLASLGHRVRATDIDPTSIEFARSRNRFSNLSLEVAGIETRDTGPYEVIIASEVLEHIRQPGEALESFRGALKPNGRVIVTIPNGYGPWEVGQALSPRRLAGWVARRTRIHGPLKKALNIRASEAGGETSTFNFESPHLQRFTVGKFMETARKAGFETLRRVHSDGPLTFFAPLRHVKFLADLDCRLVNHLPAPMASGWYFVLKPLSSS